MSFFSSYSNASKAASFLTSPGSPATQQWDYIICGGGSAGCVLANRLSEDPNKMVLLIEAGDSDQKQLNSRIPAGWANLFHTSADWDFSTVPQENAGGRQLYMPRGKMLGGCSSINAQVYQRSAPSDYDNWERKGAIGWGWKALQPYFTKAECFTSDSEHIIDQEQHGKEGPLQTGYVPATVLTEAFLDAGVEVGIPKNADLNNEYNSLGGTRFQTTIAPNGVRSSTSAAYLPKSLLATRKNLHILLSTTVTRLNFDLESCSSVEVGHKKGGECWTIFGKEIVLCLGAFGTPQLLLASGVGPKKELAQVGITSMKELPVGQGLRDHVQAPLCLEVTKGTSLQWMANPIATLPSLAKWMYDGKGPLSTNVAEGGMFLRSDSIIGGASSLRECTASGPTAPDLELITAPLYYVHHGADKPSKGGDYLSIAPVVLRPKSTGTLTISTSDVFDPPVINPCYFSDAEGHDRKLLVEGLKLAWRVAQCEPLKNFVIECVVPAKMDELSDEELVQHIEAQSETMRDATSLSPPLERLQLTSRNHHRYHPTSTCAIGAVVDSSLRVFGFPNLRIIDASVFPEALASHPNATVIAVAERAADLIKQGL